MKRRIVGVLQFFGMVLCVAGVSSIAASTPSHAVNYGDYPGGIGWAQGVDSACADSYWAARGSSSVLRAVINSSAYESRYWISSASNSSNTQIDVNATDASAIQLKLNYVTYICYGATNAGTNSLAEVDARMSSAEARSGNDYPPAPYKNYGNSPSMTFYGFGLYGIDVNGGAPNGSIAGGSYANGAQVIAARSDSTRFWHVSTDFSYNPPAGGFTADTTVNITAKVRWVNQYYYRADGKKFWEISCIDGGMKWNDNKATSPGGHGTLPDSWFTDQCGETTIPLSIHFKVKNQYNLTPGVDVNNDTAQAGTKVLVTPSVKNSGPTTSVPADWQLVSFNIPAKDTTPVNSLSGTGTGEPKTHYGYSAQNVSGANGNRSFPVTATSGTVVGPGDRDVPNQPVGTRVCWALAVKPYSHTDTSSTWRYGVPDCTTISKSPLVQIRGGDLIVGRTMDSLVKTSTKDLDGKRYGSWSEYGISASGLITGMASASGYAGGAAGSSLCSVSYLSFSNRQGATGCSDSKIGQYAVNGVMATIASRFPVVSAEQVRGDRTVGSFEAGKTYTNNGAGAEINITADNAATNTSVIPKGKWFVINAPGATVKILGNITYTTETLSSVSEIPQVIIIAKNIIIADSVAQVDAWLVATGTDTSGTINTCGAGGVGENTRLTSDICINKLTVNGPVSANHLLLRRTAGAGTGAASGDPAEVFNLRPDAYLWANALQSATPKARTVMTTELPPRY